MYLKDLHIIWNVLMWSFQIFKWMQRDFNLLFNIYDFNVTSNSFKKTVLRYSEDVIYMLIKQCI